MRLPLLIGFLFSALLSIAQDPSRFVDEVDSLLKATNEKKDQSAVVFAGSSSFRLWDGMEEAFPDQTIVNHGFGGSQTSDLACYAPLLINAYKPSKVFIYEGDNDLAEGKSVDVVIADMKTLIRGIRRSLKEVPIYIVSPKPSIVRWDLKEQYEELNEALAKLCPTREKVTFINVWDKMLEKGELNEGLFAEDGLHMNQEGYQIWSKALQPYVN